MVNTIFSRRSRGQIGFEAAWVVIILVVLGIFLIVGYPAFSELNQDIQSDVSLSTEAKTASEESLGNFASNWDGVFFFFFILLWAFMVIMAYNANTSPVFLMITVLLIVFSLVVAMLLANAYEEISLEDDVKDYAAEYPKTSWIMEHLLLVMIMVCGSTMLVLYTRLTG